MTVNFAARGSAKAALRRWQDALPHRALAIAREAAGMRRLLENPAKIQFLPASGASPRGLILALSETLSRPDLDIVFRQP